MTHRFFFPALFIISIFALLAACCSTAMAGDTGMTSQQCGSCHDSQYNMWKQGKHNTKLGGCSACHGEFHSGSLKGCTESCHTGNHKLKYKHWGFVSDYIVEGDTSDYYCIRCHNPHDPVKTDMLVCAACHGGEKGEVQPRKGIRFTSQRVHNLFAWAGPIVDDMGWDKSLKTKRGKVLFAAAGGLFGFAVLFPYLYTTYVFLRWILRKWRRRHGGVRGA